jgi:MFS family permease
VSQLDHFPALRHRNFRLLWTGQLISVTGSMMQNAAVLWHIATLVPPGSRGFALGLVGLVKVVPIVVCSLVSGVLADALDRRRVMLVTQTLMTLFAALLALLTFRGLTVVWPIYVLTALSSAAAAFDGPARQSLIPALVPREHFGNAISLNTTLFQIAAVAGPGLFGQFSGAHLGWIYALNALSFLAVIASLLAMRDVPRRDVASASDVSLRAGLEGLRFVFSSPLIRSTMLLDFFATFFASATALLPIFAEDILHVGRLGFGWLYSAQAIGALLASALLIRTADRIERRGRALLVSVAIYGLATALFGVSKSFAPMFLCLALTGAADTVSMVLRNIIRQLATPDHLRGRMTSVNMIFFMGGPQLGELEAGLVAQGLGARFSVVSGGLACLAATGIIAWSSPVLRGRLRADPGVGLEAGR